MPNDCYADLARTPADGGVEEAAAMTAGMTIRFRLNGELQTMRVPTDARLVDLLREHCALTAVKTACRIGRCGACLVLMNGHAVKPR